MVIFTSVAASPSLPFPPSIVAGVGAIHPPLSHEDECLVKEARPMMLHTVSDECGVVLGEC